MRARCRHTDLLSRHLPHAGACLLPEIPARKNARRKFLWRAEYRLTLLSVTATILTILRVVVSSFSIFTTTTSGSSLTLWKREQFDKGL